MSVYKHAKGRYWHYDFVYKGRRHHGSTGQASRRAAESVERKLRQDAAEGRLGEAAQLTLDQAAGKWWAEVGEGRGDAADVERRIERLLTLIPRATPLAEITTAMISEAIQKRRGQTFRKSKAKDAKDYAPSNATVNRDVIETLRPILRRAAINWGAKGLPAIAWKDLKLKEPRETVRIYSEGEQTAWLAENGPTARLALRLILRYGLRFGELFFPLDAFDPEGPRLSWMKGRKGDVPHSVPLLAEDARDIAARVARARAAGLDHIWYAEVTRAARTAKARPAPAQAGDAQVGDAPAVWLEPLTYYGLQARLRSSAKRAKVTPGRVIHGARHHAGTTIMRSSKNMKVVQRLLGHIDPKSTARYVHAFEDDVRAALEGEQSRNSPEPPKRKRPKTQTG
jgi:integrase